LSSFERLKSDAAALAGTSLSLAVAQIQATVIQVNHLDEFLWLPS
jgi:hypothetical protein